MINLVAYFFIWKKLYKTKIFFWSAHILSAIQKEGNNCSIIKFPNLPHIKNGNIATYLLN